MAVKYGTGHGSAVDEEWIYWPGPGPTPFPCWPPTPLVYYPSTPAELVALAAELAKLNALLARLVAVMEKK